MPGGQSEWLTQYQFEGALGRHYRAALRRDPSDHLAQFNLALVLEEQGRADEAIHAYHAALRASPDFADAHYNLGLLFDSLGKRSQAMTHLRTARKLYGRPTRN